MDEGIEIEDSRREAILRRYPIPEAPPPARWPIGDAPPACGGMWASHTSRLASWWLWLAPGPGDDEPGLMAACSQCRRDLLSTAVLQAVHIDPELAIAVPPPPPTPPAAEQSSLFDG